MIKEAKFFLDKPKGTASTHIFLKFTCKDTALKYSTGLKIEPGNWDPEKQRAVSDKKINTTLNNLSAIVSNYQDRCKALSKFVYSKELKDELNEKTNHSSGSDTSIFPHFEKIIKLAADGKILTPKGVRYTEGSLINWTKTKSRLQEFNPKLQFDSITLETYTEFIAWCNKKSYTLNYTGTLIKDLKRMMSIAYAKNMHANLIFKHPEFKILTEDSKQVALDEDEIKRIYEVDLSFNKMMEVIRDRFIVNLYNGLRISDMKKLTAGMIHNGTISSINQKTHKEVVIPVHPLVTEIIEKYNGVLPKQYHQNIVNQKIKKIARMAKITETIDIVKTIGGKKIHYSLEKCEMITNHTCRRSLTTNLLKHASIADVQPVVGMTLKTLEKYNKRSAQENAEMLKNNVFFK